MCGEPPEPEGALQQGHGLLRMDRPAEARALFERALSDLNASADQRARALIGLGDASMSLSDEQAATSFYEEAARSAASDGVRADALGLVAFCYNRQERASDAERCIREALSLKGVDEGRLIFLWCHLGNNQLRRSAPAEALESFDEALRICSNIGRYRAMILADRARALEALGRHEDVVECCNEILNDPEAYVSDRANATLGKAYALLHISRLGEALQCALAFLDMVEQDHPSASYARYYAGVALERMNRSEEACRQYRLALLGALREDEELATYVQEALSRCRCPDDET